MRGLHTYDTHVPQQSMTMDNYDKLHHAKDGRDEGCLEANTLPLFRRSTGVDEQQRHRH